MTRGICGKWLSGIKRPLLGTLAALVDSRKQNCHRLFSPGGLQWEGNLWGTLRSAHTPPGLCLSFENTKPRKEAFVAGAARSQVVLSSVYGNPKGQKIFLTQVDGRKIQPQEHALAGFKAAHSVSSLTAESLGAGPGVGVLRSGVQRRQRPQEGQRERQRQRETETQEQGGERTRKETEKHTASGRERHRKRSRERENQKEGERSRKARPRKNKKQNPNEPERNFRW